MRTRQIAAMVVLACAAPVTRCARGPRALETAAAAESFAIEHVTVVDVERGGLLPDRRIVVTGARITAVDSGTSVLPTGTRIIDGRGRFAIPGLWDMHVHTLPNDRRPRTLETFFPAFVANGVTGVRDMGGSLDTLIALRARGARTLPVAPRLVAAGPLVDGPRPAIPELSVAVATPGDAPRVVDSLAAAGVDFLKTYSRLPRATYFAIASATRRRGLPFAGHVPVEVTVREASDSGQRSVEHLADFIIDCASDAPALRAAWASALRDAPPGDAVLTASRRTARAAALAHVDWPACEALAARLARNGTWVTPTLIVGAAAADTTRARDPRRRYFDPVALAAPSAAPNPASATDQSTRQPIRADAAAPYVRVLARAGVGLLAGTDLPNAITFPGFDLHGELAQLVAAGLTPAEALRTATSNPARFLGATDSLGIVAAGKRADLVLLDANPLIDITNTTRIRAVILNGRYLDRAALDVLLANAERAANRPPQR